MHNEGGTDTGLGRWTDYQRTVLFCTVNQKNPQPICGGEEMRRETRSNRPIEGDKKIDAGFRRFGAFCSMIVGLSYLLISAAYLMQPSEMVYHTSEFWVFFTENSKLRLIHIFYHYNRVLGALLTIAVIMVVTDILLKHTRRSWLRWIRNLAYIGLSVEAINNLLKVAFEISNASAFATGNAATRDMIIVAHSWIDIDPQGIIRYTTLSLWFFAICMVAIRHGIFSRNLNYIGIVAGFSFFVGGPIAMIFQNYSLILNFVAITAGIGGMVFIPAWYVMMGMRLLNTKKTRQKINEMQPIKSVENIC